MATSTSTPTARRAVPTHYGPSIVGNVRTGTTYSNLEERWAIGNLNGVFGYATDTYGAAFGSPTGAWLKIDPTNGVRLGHNTTTKVQIEADGDATFAGAVTATAGAIGGWVLGATQLADAAGAVGLSSAVTAGDDIRLWAGDATPASAEFRVTEAGVLTATSATITGAITATSGSFTGTVTSTAGTIGGWTLGATSLTGRERHARRVRQPHARERQRRVPRVGGRCNVSGVDRARHGGERPIPSDQGRRADGDGRRD